jgi:SpoVK/Ycf46/Vps4 family AAA+-type ATPase
MTSNHPEKLDAALIRPGRVDKVLYLGYMKVPEAEQLIKHYFQTDLTPVQFQKLTDLLTMGYSHIPFFLPRTAKSSNTYDEAEFCDFKSSSHTQLVDKNGEPLPPRFTPAEMEQLCAECETIDEFLDSLQDRAGGFIGESELVIPGVKRQLSISRNNRE